MAELRPCDGCDVEDDHPRLQYQDGVNPDGSPRVRLFHYDCTPAFIRRDHPSAGYAAADSGLRGAEVAEVVAAAIAEEG